jgi:hypothetical protein
MADDLTQAIADAASTPQEAQTEAGRLKQRPLTELIEADRYLSAKNAAKKSPLLSLRIVQITPPGPT